MAVEQIRSAIAAPAKNIIARKYESVIWTMKPMMIGTVMPATLPAKFMQPPRKPVRSRVARIEGIAQYIPHQRKKNSTTDRRTTTAIGSFTYPTATIDAVVNSAATANMVRYTWFGDPPRARHSSLIQP